MRALLPWPVRITGYPWLVEPVATEFIEQARREISRCHDSRADPFGIHRWSSGALHLSVPFDARATGLIRRQGVAVSGSSLATA